jgi:hypothetical protein
MPAERADGRTSVACEHLRNDHIEPVPVPPAAGPRG